MKRLFLYRRTAVLVSLTLIIALGFHSCTRRSPFQTWWGKPRFTMAELDAKAKPFIDEANAAIPEAVATLCSHRCRLYWLLLKDKCSSGNRTGKYIASVMEPGVIAPLRKAAAVYSCALNAEAATGMPVETALDNLSQQLYAGTGMAIEAIFIRTTIDSCIHVICHCSPKLAASWGLGGACSLADGPFPIGDAIGITLAVGGTLWCCYDICSAYRALPGDLTRALEATVTSTIAQCRMEAASAL